jgi:CRP/FNR family transcriptional regulator, dissimilatory nitrate respiration regulator
MERRKPDEAVISRIRMNYLFSVLGEAEFRRCLERLEVRGYAPGEIIFHQGEHASHFFMVIDGMVRLFRASQSGEEKVIDLIQPGELFAEAVFFMGGQYPVHAAAIEQVSLASIAFDDFNDCLRSNISLAFRMMGGMSRRIHDLVNEIDRLTLGTACQRLACYLLDLVREERSEQEITVFLNAPKHIIASRIGVKPETLSRLFSRLKDEGMLEVHGHKLVLRDVDKLRNFRAEGFGEGLKDTIT